MQNLASTLFDEEEEYEVPILNTMRNVNIANFIIHEACKTYFYNFNKKWVPLSFVEFYFHEYKRYNFLSPNFLTPFFELYNDVDLSVLIDNYYQSQYNVIVGKKNSRKELYYLIEQSYYLDCNLSDNDILGMFDPKLYSDLGLIAKHLTTSDELVSLNDNYEYYMLKRFVINSDKKSNLNKAQKKAVKNTLFEQEIEQEIEEEQPKVQDNEILVGTQTEVPNQKGKVVKVFFPKLNLPSPYPILNEKSRVNSEHRVNSILRADKQIKLTNKYKFNGVQYTVSFIEKRKAANKPTKRKFDFDF